MTQKPEEIQSDIEKLLTGSQLAPVEGLQLRVAVTGASGLIGSRLAAALGEAGHRVYRIVRREPSPGADEIYWHPASGRIDRLGFEHIDAVFHLAGENVGRGRWTDARKRAIRESRIGGTRLLAETLADLDNRPRLLVSASATGFYGNRPAGELLTEDSAPGVGFLAQMTRSWEQAVEPAVAAGIRVVQPRIGLVLGEGGGVLKRLVSLFKMGLGGRIGDGQQGMSWIALEDLVRLMLWALVTESLSGPINAVAPNPVSNTEFTRALAQVLGKPAWMHVPAAVIRLMLGEMGQALALDGAYVMPKRAMEAGFEFEYPTLESALRFELGL